MRTFSLLRLVALTATLSLPLAQVALADASAQSEQQAAAGHPTYSGGGSFVGGGAYDNDAIMSPTVGE